MHKTITIKEMRSELIKAGRSPNNINNWVKKGQLVLIGDTLNEASRASFYECLHTNFYKKNGGRKPKKYNKEIK